MPFKRRHPFRITWSTRPAKRPKPNPRPRTTPRPPKVTPQPDVAESETPEIVHSQPYSGRKTARTQLALSLPPLYKLSDIYKSLTSKALELGLDDFLLHLGSRPLRVVTVCSGTESPLLALEMVQENLRKHFGEDFEFRHLFSAEIVPFKQAYIERNFHPRFIFRDVTQLKDRVAQTAYGSLEKIPKNVDLLIAGFSCVDFSGLNNKRKTLDQKGESGGTFWGIVRYARTYRPRMIILENVKTAPWKKIQQHWNEINYIAMHVDVDTKAYYLPQTRERGYMFCVDKAVMEQHGLSEKDMDLWTTVFGDFKRPASSPAGMFLMDADDRRLEQIETDMAVRIASSSSRATVNWAKYQARHQSYRLNMELGHRRPVSRSQDDGTCRMPDFAWQTWVRSLPERVWDTIDVNFLRKLVEGYDMNYKERCIELSQGLEREIDSRAYGIVGCITPCGIPYITTRGGPLCGLESLALQGLPLERLLLSRESQRELQDLAGNAMSSTVVGSAILSALIVGYKLLDKGNPKGDVENIGSKSKSLAPRDDYELVPSNTLSQSTYAVPSDLQAQAASSARYCVCERQTATRRTIFRCMLCGHTACSDCAGNPSHAFERWNDLERSQPLDFVSKLKELLPTRLVVSGITRDTFDTLKEQASPECSPEMWKDFLDAVDRAVGDELRFLDIKRSHGWSVLYEGKNAVLDLTITGSKTEWFLYATALDDEPSVSLNREILSKPIAHMVPISTSLLEGEWKVCAPLSTKRAFIFSKAGDRVQSYEAKCGLEKKKFLESKVWTQLKVQGPEEGMSDLGADIRGTYELLPDCGTANACLHKKAGTLESPAVYLFLDPTKLGNPTHDAFVFSLDHHRIPGYTARLTIAEVSHKWRSSKTEPQHERVNVHYRKWVKAPSAVLAPFAPADTITCSHLKPESTVSISSSECHDANITLLSWATYSQATDCQLGQQTWEVIDPAISPQILHEHSWLLQKTASLLDFQNWSEIADNKASSSDTDETACAICVPEAPRMIWGRSGRGQIKAYEDPHDAALYERRVKSRPPPFLVFHRGNDNQVGDLHITLNVQTLLHQAHGKLLNSDVSGKASFHWRLVPNASNVRELTFPDFHLTSNRDDGEAAQPPGFKVNLRPEQLRSLAWMIKQEDETVAPFIEEETEEAPLPQLMWRAEGRVTIPKTVHGGVLADDVGYGKTAIILGLIDTQFEEGSTYIPDQTSGLIHTNATLIVVPQVMLQQWESEITKFLGPKYKVLVFQHRWDKTIQEIQETDIILISWSMFNNQAYYQRLQKFTGMPREPVKGGRNFDDWFAAAHDSLIGLVKTLQDEGPEALLNGIHKRRKEVKQKHDQGLYVPSKRLRGQRYADAHRGEEQGAEHGMQYAEISSAEDSDGDENNPELLWKKVDQFIKLQANGKDNQYTTDDSDPGEESDCDDDSSSERPQRTGKAIPNNKRKRNAPVKKQPAWKKWNDRKEFNINHDNNDWTAVKVPIHAFTFNRLVIDEFTYADPERVTPLLALQARSKWVLSGTPPLNNFADVKTIAPFLGIHLGVDEDDEQSQNKRLKILRKQRSDAETFQSFRPPRSEAWHLHRHEVAQRFLHQFARKNVAEIDEIPSTEHIILVSQSPAEKAIYLELYKQLMTCNRQLRRIGRGRQASDQVERLDEIIGSSATVEEALLKRCSSLSLQGGVNDGKSDAITCKSLIEIREKQLKDLKDELLMKLRMAACIYCGCDLRYEKFHKFVESIIRHDFGDMDVTSSVYPLLKYAILKSRRDDWKLFFTQTGSPEDDGDRSDTPAPQKRTRGRRPANPEPEEATEELPKRPTKPKEFDAMMGDATAALRNLVVEWVLRERALRFLRSVRFVQSQTEPPQCHCCAAQPSTINDIHVLGSCGHTLCNDCISETENKEECAVDGCRGSGKKFNIINASTLGHDEDRGTQYGGAKVDKLVQLVHDIPANERALLFIQFSELMDTASRALAKAGIKHTAISSTDRKMTQKIDQFQKTSFGEDKVLILNMGSEMAAGLNLQCANHVIFLSPMLTQTQYDYDSAMTQAIGRCRRFGQARHVHVYHLLVNRTIDVDIFQGRRDKILIERDGSPLLVSHDDAAESEAMSCQGPSLVVDNAF